MSKRLKLSDLAKVVAQKAATSASKGVVISEGSETTSSKRALDDGSKGKQVAQLPESKKAKIDTGASEAPARPPIASREGSSVKRTLGETLGPQASVMASAATAEKILAGVILPADKEKVDRLTFDQVVTKFLHVLGQGVILGSSLAVRSRDFAECALNQKAVAESAEMEMVRVQNRAIELEGALAEEKAKGKKLAEDANARDKVIARLETRNSELERSQSLTQGRIIAAFKESDDFLEAVRGSASSYFGDGFDFCKRQLAHQYPDLGVDLEDVEMDHEFLAKEEAEAEKRAAEEGAAGCCSIFELHLAVNRSTVPFISSKTNLGNEESEQSLPSWISDHLGRKSYIDDTNQSPSFPPVLTDSPKMDTSSLTKEITSCPRLNWTISELRIHFPRGTTSDSWGWCLYSLSPLPDSGWYYFKARPEKNLLRGSPSNVKGWKKRFFFASGDEWEFPSGMAAGDSTPRVPRSWGTPGKSCNKLPALSEVDAKRTETIFGKIDPGGYFEVSKVLGSRTFKKHFALGCTALSSSGGDNTTSGDDGEFGTCEDSVKYLGVIRRDIEGAIRRALPGIPDKTLLRWLGGKVKDSFMNLLSGKSGSSLDSGSDSISDSELPPELRSDGKAKAEKAMKATTAKPPTKGVVIREKRTSSPDGDIGSESMMSDASMARRLLTGVIPASDKKEVDQLSENDLVTKSFHALGQIPPSLNWLKLKSELLKAENRLAELSEEGLGSKLGTEVDDLKATVAELTNKLAKAKELAIEDFKASGNSRRRLQILLQHTSVRDLSSTRGSFSINSPTLVSTWRIWRWTQVLPRKKRR
ncbi:hypothetical protein Acr_05g0016100 [Actinidia rufa]|uniref:Uncharacterized protein n=1 Tax=Actinidia rufa TaxID=165716 RepID=A0A7J0ENB0_9ERIC|nr:hypothetical protein Acr_05g0016100 [Actinidia rufa]